MMMAVIAEAFGAFRLTMSEKKTETLLMMRVLEYLPKQPIISRRRGTNVITESCVQTSCAPAVSRTPFHSKNVHITCTVCVTADCKQGRGGDPLGRRSFQSSIRAADYNLRRP